MTQELKVIDFMGKRKIAALLSLLLLIGSIASLAINGLKFGLDFTGGTQIEVGYQQPANLNQVREQLDASGFEGAVVVHFGAETDVLIRLQRGYDPGLGDEILAALNRSGEEVELRRIEFVGPQVGEELRDDGGLGMLFALVVVMAYVAMQSIFIKFFNADLANKIGARVISSINHLMFFGINSTDKPENMGSTFTVGVISN